MMHLTAKLYWANKRKIIIIIIEKSKGFFAFSFPHPPSVSTVINATFKL